ECRLISHEWSRRQRILSSAAQILVGLVNPVGTRWAEDVEVDGIRQRFGFMRHMRRDGQYLSAVHDDHFAVNPELERSFENIGDLLVVVTMFRHDAALFQQYTCEHHFLTNHKLTL